MTEDKRMFTRVLSKASENDITYLECPSIKSVINYKWENYARSFYLE